MALQVTDPQIALNYVRQARALEPDDPEWTEWLGAIYARSVRAAIAGGSGNVRLFTISAIARNEWPAFILPLADSEALKTELETSTDTALLAVTGEALVSQTRTPSGLPFSNNDEANKSAEFGNQLLQRAGQLRARSFQ